MKEPVTLDVVAHKSGVSRATASRALNNRAGVRDEVRERVQTMADALGYRPNRAAQNLAGGRSSVIGLVLGGVGRRPYAAALTRAVAKAAEQHNHSLVLTTGSAGPTETTRKLLGDRLVDGLIVSVVAAGSKWIEQLLVADALPAVQIGTISGRADVPTIDVENTESSAAVVGHLLDTGCERVGMITGRADRLDARQRIEGFRLAHARRSMRVDESLIVSGDFSPKTGYDVADRLLLHEPDGVFCANDDTARGVHLRATELGIRIPDELSLAGFDGLSVDRFHPPMVTSVAQPFDAIGLRAVATLVGLIRGEPQPDTHILEPELVFGQTSRTPVSAP